LTLNFEEEVRGVRFDKETQSFLVLFEKKLMILSKDAHFLKSISTDEL